MATDGRSVVGPSTRNGRLTIRFESPVFDRPYETYLQRGETPLLAAERAVRAAHLLEPESVDRPISDDVMHWCTVDGRPLEERPD